MAEFPTPEQAEAAMLRGFRGEMADTDGEPGPGTQLALCPMCSHTFEVLPPVVGPTRVTE